MIANGPHHSVEEFGAMSTVLGIDIGSRGAIVEGPSIDALDLPCLNDGPAGRRAVNGPLLAGLARNPS